MRRNSWCSILISLTITVFLACAVTSGQEKTPGAAKPDLDMTASYIEACSCDMFCPVTSTPIPRITAGGQVGRLHAFPPRDADTV
jgi:hypothetical protein